MAFSVNTENLPTTSGSEPTGIALLYPPQKRDGDTSTITGLIKGCGYKGFSLKEGATYSFYQLTLYAKSGDDTKEYNHIVKDFFAEKATDDQASFDKRVKLNIRFYYDTVYAALGTNVKEDGTPLFPVVSLDSLKAFVDHVTENTPADFFNPEASFKVVNQKAFAEKQYYNLSQNFPIVESPGFNEGKVKFVKENEKYGDQTLFSSKAPQTDGMLGGGNDFTMPVVSTTELNSLM